MGVPKPKAYACTEPLVSSGQHNPVRSGAACLTATSPATAFVPGPACIGLRRQHDSQLDDEWPESIFHHVGSQSVSYLLSVQCEVFKSSELR